MISFKEQAMQEKMQELKRSYLEQLQERKGRFDQLLSMLDKQSLSDEDRAELKSQAHKLAGTGTIYGFPSISDLARKLEDGLSDNAEPGTPPAVPETAVLRAAYGAALEERPKLEEQPRQEELRKLEEQPKLASSIAPPAGVDAEAGRARLPLLLVVDDDQNIRNIMLELFKDDARIITGTNGTEALELMARFKPDLILLDDDMPGGMSGLQMLEERHSRPDIKDIPIIMITGSDQPKEVMRGLMAGAADYITKPFRAEDIVAKVRGRLSRQDSVILIADDDEAVRELLEHKFQMAGCKVVCAADGAEAWAKMQEQPFALVVLDRMMPGHDGMTLLRMMRAKSELAATPVVFLTARHYGADVLEGLNTGAADYIVKPFNPDEVITRCMRLIGANGAQEIQPLPVSREPDTVQAAQF